MAYCPSDGLTHAFRTVDGVPIANPMCSKQLGPERDNPDKHTDANVCGRCLPLFLAHLQIAEEEFMAQLEKLRR